MADINFDCPECGHTLVVDKSGAGLVVPCPECLKSIKIPAPSNMAQNMSVFNAQQGMKYISMGRKYIKAECPTCKRILRVSMDNCLAYSGGYSLPQSETCLCGAIWSNIQGAKSTGKSFIQHNNQRLSKKNSQQCCPHGHGITGVWEGQPRCFVCGWPQNPNHSSIRRQSSGSNARRSSAGSMGTLQIIGIIILLGLFAILSITSDEPITFSDDQKFMMRTIQLNEIYKGLKK